MWLFLWRSIRNFDAKPDDTLENIENVEEVEPPADLQFVGQEQESAPTSSVPHAFLDQGFKHGKRIEEEGD